MTQLYQMMTATIIKKYGIATVIWIIPQVFIFWFIFFLDINMIITTTNTTTNFNGTTLNNNNNEFYVNTTTTATTNDNNTNRTTTNVNLYYQDSIRRRRTMLTTTTDSADRHGTTEASVLLSSSSTEERSTTATTTTTRIRTSRTLTDSINYTLPISDINILIITDDHSWLGGHNNGNTNTNNDNENTNNNNNVGRYYDADIGHIVSFYERLYNYIKVQQNKDLYIIMNGDWIDGTGLAYSGHIQHLIPLLEKIPYDIVNCGNHELYDNSVIQQAMYEPGNFIEWWGSKYITSNVRKNLTTYRALQKQQRKQRQLLLNNQSNANSSINNETIIDNQRSLWLWENDDENDSNDNLYPPVGNHYRILNGITSNVLVFGFLYNMDEADTLISVQHIQDVIQEQWFIDVITKQRRIINSTTGLHDNDNTDNDKYDTIVILAHMGARDNLIQLLIVAIRTLLNNDYLLPIQIIAGHTHVRDYVQINSTTNIIESGKYLETIGYISFPSYNTIIQSTQQFQEQALAQAEQQQAQLLLDQQQQQEQQAKLNQTNTSSISLGSNTSTQIPTSSNNSIVSDENIADDTNNRRRQLQVQQNDDDSSSMEQTTIDTIISNLFQYKFIDAKQSILQSIFTSTTNNDDNTIDYKTENGIEITDYIQRTRRELGLLTIIGCIPTSYNYYIDKSLYDVDSLWRLFVQELVPYIFYSHHIIILQQGEWRYNLLSNDVSIDDIHGVSPYNTSFVQLTNISYNTIIELNNTLNRNNIIVTSNASNVDNNTNNRLRFAESTNNGNGLNRTLPYPAPYLQGLPLYIMASAVPLSDKRYTLIISKWEEHGIVNALQRIDPDWVPIPAQPFKLDDNETITTTSMWITFIKEKYPGPCDGNSFFSGFGNTNNNHHGNHDVYNSNGGGTSGIITSKDQIRIVMSSIALLIVIVLSVMYIQQRSKVYANVSAAQNHAVLSALHEYNQRDNDKNANRYYDDDDDDDDDNEDNNDDDNDNQQHQNVVNDNDNDNMYGTFVNGNNSIRTTDKKQQQQNQQQQEQQLDQEQVAISAMKDLLDVDDDELL